MAYEQYTNGIPYLAPGSLLSDIPSYTQAVAPKLVNSRGETLSTVSDLVDDHETRLNNTPIPHYLGDPSHYLGNFGIGASGPYHCSAIAFNGEVGDVWTANFSATVDIPAGGTPGGIPASCTLKLATLAGVPLHSSNPAASWTMACSTNSAGDPATYTWKATAANDYLLAWIVRNDHGVANLRIYAKGLINFGAI